MTFNVSHVILKCLIGILFYVENGAVYIYNNGFVHDDNFWGDRIGLLSVANSGFNGKLEFLPGFIELLEHFAAIV